MTALYLRCGTPWVGEPHGFNQRGRPFVAFPVKPGAQPTRRALYSAEHVSRLMCADDAELGAAHEPHGVPLEEWT